MRARNLVFLLLLVTAAGVRAEAESLETRIANAVARGTDFLIGKFDRETGWGNALGTGVYGGVGQAYPYDAGPTALCVFALLKAGVDPEHDVLRRAMSFLRVKHRTPGVSYEISVELLAVAEYGGARKSPDYRTAEWREHRTRDKYHRPKGTPFERKYWTWLCDLAGKLISFQAENGGWRYYPDDFHSGGRADVSSTQFALLALSTASRCGYDVPREVFERARDFLLASQESEGPAVPRAVHVPGGPDDARDRARGFPYIANSEVFAYQRVSGGMTAAGVASLLLVHEELGPDAQLEQALLDGFAWLGRYFTVVVNPGYAPFLTGSYHYTALYAMERAGDLASREVWAGRSWFPEGARMLLERQREDGAFSDPTCMNPQDVLGTAFALLFLTRASKPVSG